MKTRKHSSTIDTRAGGSLFLSPSTPTSFWRGCLGTVSGTCAFPGCRPCAHLVHGDSVVKTRLQEQRTEKESSPPCRGRLPFSVYRSVRERLACRDGQSSGAQDELQKLGKAATVVQP